MFGYTSRVTSAISNNISYAAFLIIFPNIFKAMLYKGVRKREILSVTKQFETEHFRGPFLRITASPGEWTVKNQKPQFHGNRNEVHVKKSQKSQMSESSSTILSLCWAV